MKGCINNKMGQIQIDTDVIALYAGTTAVECFGIVGMADSITKVSSFLTNRTFSHDSTSLIIHTVGCKNP